MDVFYEECAVNQKAVKEERIYKILNVIFYISLFIAIIAGVFALLNFPIGDIGGLTGEEKDAALIMRGLFSFMLFVAISATALTVSMYFLKRRLNISYDYIFVSGELRIVKVFNINKRKLITRIQPENILQLGDLDNESFSRLATNPANKQVICTPNYSAAIGKFFMYAHVNEPMGNRLYILECREELLVNILHFVKRGTLESDYVSQEKKQK